MIKHLLIYLLLIPVISAYSQNNEYFDDLKNVFDKEKQEQISKITEKFKAMQNIEIEADKLLSSGDTSKSLSLIEKASGVYETEYRTLYLMFDEKLLNLFDELEGDKKNSVKNMLRDAGNSFRLSIANRLSAGEEKEEKLAYELYISAHSSEVDAVNTQCRAFATITGQIDPEMNDEDVISDYSLDETFDNSVTENFYCRSFVIRNVSLPDNFYNNNRNNNNPDISVDPINENSYSGQGSEYRIQIGTSIIPANESQINRLNSSDLEVKTFKSKIYYKYTIGSFSSFQEAKNYKNAYGLAKTYIVEYKNGKEVKFYFKDFQ